MPDAGPARDAPEDLEGVINAQVTELDIADREQAELAAALARAQAHIAAMERDYESVWRSHCTIQAGEGAGVPDALADARAGAERRRELRALEAQIAELVRARNRVVDMEAGEGCLEVRVLGEPDREHIRALRAARAVLRAQNDALEEQLLAARQRTACQRAEHDEAATAMGLVRASMEAHNARLAVSTAQHEEQGAGARAAAQRSAAEAAGAAAALADAAQRLAQLQAALDAAGGALRACEERREHVERDHALQLAELERVKLDTRSAAEARRGLQQTVARLQGVLATIHAKYAEFCQMQLAQHDAQPALPPGACRTCSAGNDYIQQSFMLVEDIVDKLGESLALKRLELHALLQDSSLDDWHGAPAARAEHCA